MFAKSPQPVPPVSFQRGNHCDSGKDYSYHGVDYPEHSLSRAFLHLGERANPARRKAQKTSVRAPAFASTCERDRNVNPGSNCLPQEFFQPGFARG